VGVVEAREAHPGLGRGEEGAADRGAKGRVGFHSGRGRDRGAAVAFNWRREGERWPDILTQKGWSPVILSKPLCPRTLNVRGLELEFRESEYPRDGPTGGPVGTGKKGTCDAPEPEPPCSRRVGKAHIKKVPGWPPECPRMVPLGPLGQHRGPTCRPTDRPTDRPSHPFCRPGPVAGGRSARGRGK